MYKSKSSTIAELAVTLGERGRMVLPAPIREQLNLRGGDKFLVRIDDDGSIRLVSYRSVADQNRGLFAKVAPGRSLADELIGERRSAAAREARA